MTATTTASNAPTHSAGLAATTSRGMLRAVGIADTPFHKASVHA